MIVGVHRFKEKKKEKKQNKKEKVLSSLRIDLSLPLWQYCPRLTTGGQQSVCSFFMFFFFFLVFIRLLFCLPEPGEKGCDRFQGHTFSRLLCRVFAGLPLVEGLLFNNILVVQGIEEHPQQVCRDTQIKVSNNSNYGGKKQFISTNIHNKKSCSSVLLNSSPLVRDETH